jgi:type IV secretion system protein VirD4
MKRDSPKQTLTLCAFGLIPVAWAALLAAPALSGGLVEILQNLMAALNSPFAITWCGDSLKTVLIFIAAYAMGIGIYFSTRRNTRPKEEHGSAKWGEAAAVNKKYADKRFCENKVLTQNVRIGFDAHKHRRNLNVLVCGGSGAGKTRFYCKPNAMNCNTSMVILDPKGEIARDTGNLLKAQGMEVKVLDLINM